MNPISTVRGCVGWISHKAAFRPDAVIASAYGSSHQRMPQPSYKDAAAGASPNPEFLVAQPLTVLNGRGATDGTWQAGTVALRLEVKTVGAPAPKNYLLSSIRVCSGHTAAPATALGRLRFWRAANREKTQSTPSASPPGARRQHKGMLGICGVLVRGSGSG